MHNRPVFPGFTHDALLTFTMVIFVAAGAAGCRGEGGICGNGVTESKNNEECDCGTDPTALPSTCIDINGGPRSHCTADCKNQPVNYTTINVNWSINGLWPEGGSFDHCNDLPADQVHIATYGPAGFYDEQWVGCSAFQYRYTESQQMPLAAGTYTVAATLLRRNDAVAEPAMGQGLVQIGWTTDIWVDFPLETLYGYEDFTGDLLVRFTWESAECTDASPIFATEQIVLSMDASPLAGYPMQRPCEAAFWIINGLPTGDLLMRIEGIVDGTDIPFCDEFPIKVGIGNNRPYFLDVRYTQDGSCFPP